MKRVRDCYNMRTESKKHKEIREIIAKAINGINKDDQIRVLNGYYPDVQTENSDIEVEIYNKRDHILNKRRFWNKNKKKILILGIPDELREIFDEIILFNDKDFMPKLKKCLFA
jgi:hypothetical protein